MKNNIGTLDKGIRVLLAAVIAMMYFTGVISGNTATVLLVLAAVFILTSLIGFCPLYFPFGLSTCKKTSNS